MRRNEKGSSSDPLNPAPTNERPCRVQEMTEAFLNTPLGAQYDSMNVFLREKDPDAMMLNLGLPLSDDHPRSVTSGTGHGEDGGFSLPSGIAENLSSFATSLQSGDEAGKAAAAAAASQGPSLSTNNTNIIDGARHGARHDTGSGTLSPGAEARPTFPQEPPPPSVRPPGQPSGMHGYPSPSTSLLSQMFPSPASHAVVDSGIGGRRAKDFHLLVRTLGAHGRFEEARSRAVPEMMRRGIRPTPGTFAALLAGAAVDKNPGAAEEVGGDAMGL